MKKVILKTASITLAAVIVAALICYGVFACFFPYNLASFYRGVSNYDLALKYSERGYQKSATHDVSELLIVVYDAIDAQNDKQIEKYAAKSLLSGDLSQSERLHVSQRYCVALYNLNKKNLALEKAADLTLGGALTTGYVKGNPLRSVMGEALQCASDGMKKGEGVSAELTEYIKKIGETLKNMQTENPDMPENQSALLSGDISVVGEFLKQIESKTVGAKNDFSAPNI